MPAAGSTAKTSAQTAITTAKSPAKCRNGTPEMSSAASAAAAYTSDVPRSGSRNTRPGGDRDVAEREQRHARAVHAIAAIGDERGEREQHGQLAELGGLELEAGQRDPAGRAADRRAEHEHDGDEPERAEVERHAQPPPERRIDRGHRDHADAADDEVDRLAADVVARDRPRCRAASRRRARSGRARRGPPWRASSSQSSRRAIESTRERGRLRERRRDDDRHQRLSSVKLSRVASEGGVLPK